MKALTLAAAGAAMLLAADAAAAGPDTATPVALRRQLQPQTLDSMLTRALSGFDRLDVNKDGRLTAQEREQAQAAPDGPGGRRVGPGGRRGFGGLGRAEAQGDGVVTRAEAEAQVRERFSRLDGNRDGRLSVEEMRAGRREGGRPGEAS